MKKNVLLVTVAAVLLLVGLLAGCAKTVTVTVTGPPAPGATIITTITQVVGIETQTSVVALTGVPPKIPHGATVGGMYGPCFSCHPIPAGHTGRIANESFCGQCHQQGEYLLAE